MKSSFKTSNIVNLDLWFAMLRPYRDLEFRPDFSDLTEIERFSARFWASGLFLMVNIT